MSSSSSQHQYDICIIGGGINGVGIARDAAGRGLKVLVCEQNDLASATSSASSKLIHGGLRYLEHYEFRLVREALSERETLLDIAPHLVQPLRFVLPHEPHLRPAWMIRCGLFLYDHLAKRSARLPGSSGISLSKENDYGKALKDHYTTGFIYSDCQVDDSRLVILNAMSARQHGATILTRSKVTAVSHDDQQWHITITKDNGSSFQASAKILINAAGPWVSQLEKLIRPQQAADKLRLVKGSHIVVPKFYPGNHAYILQNKDNRIVFATPFRDHFAMIGTTDVDYTGDPANVVISEEEILYLLELINGYFTKPLTRADVISAWSGVRPLYNDSTGSASAVTRDYVFDLSGGNSSQPPLLSIYGGKITTYRRLAEHALEKLARFTGKPKAWTSTEKLPGGDIQTPEQFAQQLTQQYPWISDALAMRYTKAYGNLVHAFLSGNQADMGQNFGHDLYASEVNWLIEQEWALSVDDILWRRTRLGLLFTPQQKTVLENYIQAKVTSMSN
ncbi:glycerol-3-phosphate dehydrogenase [Pelistega europaea]|uniref:Glycerol-3-phosphate dehydrogenase n=1 Tax=Pelistega europaea TaxID=106147 RepID=A0A7Y4LDN3_9BURK|nr:glycerol-3-phosphate dehydrogenase [Pelistega europaea]NOL50481.1 glycerol-3-phosphate dehydrogenase [Pelistega europaea]